MKRYPILEVCARIEGHKVQQQMLREYCQEFDDWQGLLERAAQIPGTQYYFNCFLPIANCKMLCHRNSLTKEENEVHP